MYMYLYIWDMAKRYSIAAARANLAAIVDEADAGQAIELTRRGAPVAVVLSAREHARLLGAPASFAAAYQRFLGTHDLAEVGQALRVRRSRSPGRDVAP